MDDVGNQSRRKLMVICMPAAAGARVVLILDDLIPYKYKLTCKLLILILQD